MGADVPPGVVRHVDGVVACSLQGEPNTEVSGNSQGSNEAPNKENEIKTSVINLSIDASNRASCHPVSNASGNVELVAQKVFEAAIAELE